MASCLPLDLIVDITSTSVKDTFTIGKMNTLLIDKYNDDLPNKDFVQITDLSQAQSIFGFESDVAKFASIYFGFVSKNATKCDFLFVYSWNKTDKPAVLKGGKVQSLAQYEGIKGAFSLTISGVKENVELDLSELESPVQTYQELALKLQEAINKVDNQNFTNAVVEYNSFLNGFVVKSGLSGDTESIGYFESPTQADEGEQLNDISSRFGLTQAEGATLINGLSGKATLAEALNYIDLINGNFYLITPNFAFDDVDTELKQFGEFLNASNDRYCGVYSWDNLNLLSLDSGATEAFEGYNGLIIDYKTAPFQNALVCSLISALDLTKPSGNYNIAFNDATQWQINAITEKLKYQGLLDNKANAPCKFGILGQDDTIYMDGTILGNKTSSINVYVCNSFLKFNQQIQLYNMFKSQKLIGVRGSQSKSLIYAYIDSVFQSAINANIIAQDVELTTTEQQSLISTFGALVDDINIVLEKLSTTGYFYIISSIDLVKREIGITEAYVANTPAKRIVINSYILGA